MQRVLSTSEFAAAVGLSESTVRRMADRGELKMHRTQGGHRRIPASELLRYARESGATIAGFEMQVLSRPDAGADVHRQHRLVAESLVGGDAGQVVTSLRTLYAAGMTIAELCDGPLRQAMQAVGSRWPHDPQSIFIEHRATAICLQALGRLWSEIPVPADGAPTAMGAAPPSDPYLLPSLMASLVLRDCGYRETNLGPDLPLDVLTDAVERDRPDVVWLAITRPLQSLQYTREIDRLSVAVQKYGGRFLIGGDNVATSTSRRAERCRSMTELHQRAVVSAAVEPSR